MAALEFVYQDPTPLPKDATVYSQIPGSEMSVTLENFAVHSILQIVPEALTARANTAMRDVSLLLRKEHNEEVNT